MPLFLFSNPIFCRTDSPWTLSPPPRMPGANDSFHDTCILVLWPSTLSLSIGLTNAFSFSPLSGNLSLPGRRYLLLRMSPVSSSSLFGSPLRSGPSFFRTAVIPLGPPSPSKLSILSESGVRASANAHSRSYMSMHADPS